jgi:predicted N-acetyltransferase YhbS
MSPSRPLQAGWFALGPVSVEPALQRQGIGFVVSPGLAPSTVPAQHFQIVCFADARPAAPVAFHPAFGAHA